MIIHAVVSHVIEDIKSLSNTCSVLNEQVDFATSKLNACKIIEEEGSLLTHLFYLNILKNNLFLNEGY